MIKSESFHRISKLINKSFPDDHYYVSDILEIKRLIEANGGKPASTTDSLLDREPQYESLAHFQISIHNGSVVPNATAYLCIPNEDEAGLLVMTAKGKEPLLMHMLDNEERHGTDNRRRLQLFTSVLSQLSHQDFSLTLIVDDEVLAKGSMNWICGWDRNGWVTSKGSPVQNADLWKEVLSLKKFYKRLTIKDVSDKSVQSIHKEQYFEFVAGLSAF